MAKFSNLQDVGQDVVPRSSGHLAAPALIPRETVGGDI